MPTALIINQLRQKFLHFVFNFIFIYIFQLTNLFTNLIRIHLDNIYVNKLTMKQQTTIVINKCKLNYNCKQRNVVVYLQTKIIQ